MYAGTFSEFAGASEVTYRFSLRRQLEFLVSILGCAAPVFFTTTRSVRASSLVLLKACSLIQVREPWTQVGRPVHRSLTPRVPSSVLPASPLWADPERGHDLDIFVT